MQQEQTELSEVLFSEVNPIPIKEACYLKGLINDNSLRMPLSNIEDDNKKRLVLIPFNTLYLSDIVTEEE